jgi:predicted kinase
MERDPTGRTHRVERTVVEQLARQAGVRVFGHWIEGPEEALYRFAELIVEHLEHEDEVSQCV